MAFSLGGVKSIWEILSDTINTMCIKSASASVARDGTVVLTLVLLGDHTTVVQSLADNGITVSKIARGTTTTSVSITDRRGVITNLKIQRSAIFKSVYKGVLDLHLSGIIPREVVSPTEFPEADVYLKECESPYEDDGWTVSEIFNVLGVHVRFPSRWNYHVTKLTVTAGMPVISLVQNLFPFPGIYFHRIGGWIVVGQATQVPTMTACDVISHQSQSTNIALTVVGDTGRVKYARADHTSVEIDGRITYIKNRLGGVFGITYSEVEDVLDRIATRVWSTLV